LGICEIAAATAEPPFDHCCLLSVSVPSSLFHGLSNELRWEQHAVNLNSGGEFTWTVGLSWCRLILTT